MFRLDPFSNIAHSPCTGVELWGLTVKSTTMRAIQTPVITFPECSSFGADSDRSLAPFPFSLEWRRCTKLWLLQSIYRRHQQGVLSGGSWTLNIELFLICIGATPNREDGIMNHAVSSRHGNEWRRCPNQRSSGFSSQEADGKDKLWMSAVVDPHKSSYD